MAPTVAANIIAALCYAMEEFSRLKTTKDYIVSTSKLQTWNQPRKRVLDPRNVASLLSWSMGKFIRKSTCSLLMTPAHQSSSVHMLLSYTHYMQSCNLLVSRAGSCMSILPIPVPVLLRFPHAHPLQHPLQHHCHQFLVPQRKKFV